MCLSKEKKGVKVEEFKPEEVAEHYQAVSAAEAALEAELRGESTSVDEAEVPKPDA